MCCTDDSGTIGTAPLSDTERLKHVPPVVVVWRAATQGRASNLRTALRCLSAEGRHAADGRQAFVEDLPALIIHGTTEEAWLMIRTQGISPMSRQHVHLATTAAQVKRHCVVHIYVDTHRFLERGHLLLRARNGLILSRGHVPPAFFASAWHTRRRIDLLRATDADWLQPEAMSRWQADASGGGCARWDGWQADADGGGWERWSSWQADASGGGGRWSSWRADAGGGGWEPECEQEPCIEARSCSWP